MGTYNTIRVDIACPRCGAREAVDVELRLGDTSQLRELRIGDRYPWAPNQPPEKGGRPDRGNAVGDGYMECDRCHKDSFLWVVVRDDVIVSVEPNCQKKPYIAD